MSALAFRVFPARLMAAITVLACLAGCDISSGTSLTEAKLAADMATYVETDYAPGLLELVHAQYAGPQWIPNFARDHRTVEYTAELRLKRDYDFGVWDQTGAATLAQMLGAKPAALLGLKADGNKTGDILRVTGTLIYTQEKDGTRALSGAAPKVPSANVLAWRDRRDLLQEWWFATKVAARGIASPIDAIDADFVFAGVKATAARLMRERADGKASVAIASGTYGEDYWTVAQAISDNSAAQRGKPLINLETSGSRENLRLLRDRAVSAAIVRGDEAAFALSGEGPFARDGTFPELRALGALFPEPIHVVVMSNSPIASVADLFNRRVAITGNGLATGIGAGDALRAHRVPLASLAAAPEIRPIEQTLAALEKGECDAVIITTAAPMPALREFALAHAIRLLPLDADALALMTTGTSNYVAITIPARTYPGQNKSIATVAITTLLVSSAAIPGAEIETLLQQTYNGVDFIGHGSTLGALIRRGSARRGLSVPLHSGAEAFYGLPPAKDSAK